MKRVTVLVFTALLLSFVPHDGLNAACRADAEVMKSWTGRRVGDPDFSVRFRVKSDATRGYCSGLVEYYVHYVAPSGRAHRESSLVRWSYDASRQNGVEVVGTAESVLCNGENDVCEINDVEVRKVSCSD